MSSFLLVSLVSTCLLLPLLTRSGEGSKTVELTPSNIAQYGAYFSLVNKYDVSMSPDAWDMTVSVQDGWYMHLLLDETWGFDASGASTIQIDIDSNTDITSADLDLILGFSTDDTEYFTLWLSLTTTDHSNWIYTCDTSNTPTTSLLSGNLETLVDDSTNRQTDTLAYDHTQITPSITNAFPLQFTLTNSPNDALFIEITNPHTSTVQSCGYINGFATNQGLNMYVTMDDAGETMDISSVFVNYTSFSESPTSEPTGSPSLPPSQAPTNIPSAPSQPPSDAPSFAPTHPSYAPSSSPTSPSQPPTVTPSGSPSQPPTNVPSFAPTDRTLDPTTAPSQPSQPPTLPPSYSPSQTPTESPIVPIFRPLSGYLTCDDITSVSGTMVAGGTYYYEIVISDTYDIHFTNCNSTFDTTMIIWDENENILNPNGDYDDVDSSDALNCNKGTRETLEITGMSTDLRYYVQLSAWSSGSTGTYVIDILCQTYAPTNAPTQPPTLTPSASPTQPPSRTPSVAPTQPPTNSPTFAPTNAPTIIGDEKNQMEVFIYYNVTGDKSKVFLPALNRELAYSVQLAVENVFYNNSYKQTKYIHDCYTCITFTIFTFNEDDYLSIANSELYDCGELEQELRDSSSDLRYQPWTKRAKYLAVSKIIVSGDDQTSVEQKVSELNDYFDGTKSEKYVSNFISSVETCIDFGNNDDSSNLDVYGQCTSQAGLNNFEIISIEAALYQKIKTVDKDYVFKLFIIVFNWAIYGLMIFCAGLALAGFIQAKRKRADNVKPMAVLFFGFYAWDFYSDFAFTIRLCGAAQRGSIETFVPNMLWYLFCISLIFIGVPYLLNVRQIINAQEKWATDKKVKEKTSNWLLKYEKRLLMCVCISGNAFGAIELCNSNLFRKSFFSMGLPQRLLKQFQSNRLSSSVLFENVPQLIIQIYFLILIQRLDQATVVALLSSSVSIVLSAVDIWAARRMIRLMKKLEASGEDLASFEFFFLKSDEVEMRKRFLMSSPKKISKCIAQVLAIDRRSVEVFQILSSAIGIKVSFAILLTNSDMGSQRAVQELNADLLKLQLLLSSRLRLRAMPILTHVRTGAVLKQSHTKKLLQGLEDEYEDSWETDYDSENGRVRAWSESSMSLKKDIKMVQLSTLNTLGKREMQKSIREFDPQLQSDEEEKKEDGGDAGAGDGGTDGGGEDFWMVGSVSGTDGTGDTGGGTSSGLERQRSISRKNIDQLFQSLSMKHDGGDGVVDDGVDHDEAIHDVLEKHYFEKIHAEESGSDFESDDGSVDGWDKYEENVGKLIDLKDEKHNEKGTLSEEYWNMYQKNYSFLRQQKLDLEAKQMKDNLMNEVDNDTVGGTMGDDDDDSVLNDSDIGDDVIAEVILDTNNDVIAGEFEPSFEPSIEPSNTVGLNVTDVIDEMMKNHDFLD